MILLHLRDRYYYFNESIPYVRKIATGWYTEERTKTVPIANL